METTTTRINFGKAYIGGKRPLTKEDCALAIQLLRRAMPERPAWHASTAQQKLDEIDSIERVIQKLREV